MRARWPLAVCGVTPAMRASSEAVSARPSISACSMPARAGSPASAATSANVALLANGLPPACSLGDRIPFAGGKLRSWPQYERRPTSTPRPTPVGLTFSAHQHFAQVCGGHSLRGEPCGDEHPVEVVTGVAAIIGFVEASWEALDEAVPGGPVAQLQAIEEHE